MEKQRTYTTEQVVQICQSYGLLRDQMGREFVQEGTSVLSSRDVERIMREIPLDVYEGIQRLRGCELGKDDDLTRAFKTIRDLEARGI